MRDRLLAPVAAPPTEEAVLNITEHRVLLGLIARHQPPSIAALRALAEPTHPDFSRALLALVQSGLVVLDAPPRVTTRGATRARDLGLPL